jgi:hypothetical protein
MRRFRFALLICALLSIGRTPLSAATAGKATGKLVVSKETRPLSYAYVVEKDKLLKIVLSSVRLEDDQLFDSDALQNAVDEQGISAIVIRLDEDRRADSTLFFDPDLPAGLEVRQLGTFEAKKSTDTQLAGRVVLSDKGNSFTYDVTFDAPIVLALQNVEPLAADASPSEHALWRLKQMELKFDETTFRSVVIDGDADAVELFVTAGMSPDAQDAIRLALDTGKDDVVKVLLAHGADKNAKDAYGQSLMMTAASNHRVEAMKQLIAAGADIDVPNEYGITPLAVAAEQGHLDEVNLLVAAHAKVNTPDNYGGTALSVAVLRGYKEIVAALIAAGADVKRDKAQLLALAEDKPEILAMLEKALK